MKNYKEFIYESTQRVRGQDPARAFVGLRLRTLDEITTRQGGEKDAATQVTPTPPAVHKPAEPPVEENPFG